MSSLRYTDSIMDLEISSGHAWFEQVRNVWSADNEATQLRPILLCSINIGGVEEFYSLDEVYEITVFGCGSTFKTHWRRVIPTRG